MDFTLDEQHTAVSELTARILGDLVTTERLDVLGGDLDRHTWKTLADAGVLGVALPEPAGGSGMGFLAAHLVLEQIGRFAAPVPYWETIVLGAMPLATFGTPAQQQRWLGPVLAGDVLLTAALPAGPVVAAASPVTARRDAGGWVLDGVESPVPSAAQVAAILIPAVTDDGRTGVWIVPADTGGVVIEPQEVITGAPYGAITLEGVRVDDDALLGGLGTDTASWLFTHGAAGLASLAAGLCAAAVRLSADYTSRREQFGRPVATFQAVAQRVADAYIDAEAVQLTALQAAWRLAEGLPADDEVAIAKWWAAEAGHRVIHAATHVHGGVGVDRSYPLHRYFAALKHVEFLNGSAPTHLLRIGARMAAEPV